MRVLLTHEPLVDVLAAPHQDHAAESARRVRAHALKFDRLLGVPLYDLPSLREFRLDEATVEACLHPLVRVREALVRHFQLAEVLGEFVFGAKLRWVDLATVYALDLGSLLQCIPALLEHVAPGVAGLRQIRDALLHDALHACALATSA